MGEVKSDVSQTADCMPVRANRNTGISAKFLIKISEKYSVFVKSAF